MGTSVRAEVPIDTISAQESTTLEATQGQIDGFFSQLPYKYHQNWVASVGDRLRIFPWVGYIRA